LADPVIGKSDVIIGPIPEESDYGDGFAEQAKIPFFIPFSNLGERLRNLDFQLLIPSCRRIFAEGIIKGLESQKGALRVAIALFKLAQR